MKNLLTYQEIKTSNDVNGNPRSLVIVSILNLETLQNESMYNQNFQDHYYIEMGYRSPLQAVEETFDTDQYIIKRLPTVSVPIKEYKRFKKDTAYTL